MARKTHLVNGVEFGFIGGGRWRFKTGQYAYITPCNGVESATKVAGVIAGGLKREAKQGRLGIDGMARAQIAKSI